MGNISLLSKPGSDTGVALGAVRPPSIRTSFVVAVFASLLWLAVRLLTTRHVPAPEPQIHDEFSYLLGADTFVHGRLANPPHPLGRFFESPHILIQPTYSSKFPPGQAAWLALGIRLLGSPYRAVLFQSVCLVFVLALMFCAWTRLTIAALMTFLAGFALLPPVLTWSLSYMGGSAAAIGAALVLCALGWFLRVRSPVATGVVMTFGVLSLFFTRPYEGGVFCAALLVGSAWLLRQNLLRQRTALLRLALSAAPILLTGFAWNAYYNYAVTGNPLRMPYLLFVKTYTVSPVFCFAPLQPEPTYGNSRLAAQFGLHGWEVASYRQTCSSRIWPVLTFFKTGKEFGRIILPLIPILVLLPFSWADKRCRLLFLVAAACFLSVVLEVWHFPHYLAPTLVVTFLYCDCAVEQLFRLPHMTTAHCALMTSGLVVFALGYEAVNLHKFPLGADDLFGQQRAQLIRRLSELNGQQLIVVHYPDASACPELEWVYNGADPDHQKVVLAHDLGASENKVMFDYYRNRRNWLLTANCNNYRLSPLAR